MGPNFGPKKLRDFATKRLQFAAQLLDPPLRRGLRVRSQWRSWLLIPIMWSSISRCSPFCSSSRSMLCCAPQKLTCRRYLTQLSQLIDHGDHDTMAQIVVHLTTPFGRLTQHMRCLIYAEVQFLFFFPFRFYRASHELQFEQAPDPSSILRRNSVASRVMAILAHICAVSGD